MRKQDLKKRKLGSLAVFVVLAIAGSLLYASSGGAVVAGAGFTTFDETLGGCLNGNNPNGVNCNLYESKLDVYMSGGPASGKSALSDGEYFFAVVTPGEENGGFIDGAVGNLSDNVEPAGATEGDVGGGDEVSNRTFSVTNHVISAYPGTHATGTNPDGKFVIGLAPFDDTDNPGGVYILAICKVGATSPSDCKYDAFKISKGGSEEEELESFGTISGEKYYDVNHNGVFDPGEAPLPGWAIDWTDSASGTALTDSTGVFEVGDLVADTYTFTEQQGPAGWIQTGNTENESSASAGSHVTLENKKYIVELAEGGIVSGLKFGNVCEIKNSNGLTLGFWSNKNGEKILKAKDPGWRNLLAASNLVKYSNSEKAWVDYNPPSYPDFRTWLLNATATNMSYMLSAQLATTQLDIAYNGLNGNDLVLDPKGNWVSINKVIEDAITFLGTHRDTTAAGPDRTLAEAYKNIFDGLNNNIQKITPVDPGKCPEYSFVAAS